MRRLCTCSPNCAANSMPLARSSFSMSYMTPIGLIIFSSNLTVGCEVARIEVLCHRRQGTGA